ncbi:hypothetical protein L915_18777, partial [Phytophthora nicotianae]
LIIPGGATSSHAHPAREEQASPSTRRRKLTFHFPVKFTSHHSRTHHCHNGLHDRRPPIRQGRQGGRGEATQQADRSLAGVLQGHRDHRLARDAGPPRPAQVVHRRALRAREQSEVPPGKPVLEDVRPVRHPPAGQADGSAPLQRAGHEQARARRVSARANE